MFIARKWSISIHLYTRRWNTSRRPSAREGLGLLGCIAGHILERKIPIVFELDSPPHVSPISIFCRDGRATGKAGRRGQAAGEGDEDSDVEEDEKFLSLDDTLEEGTGLDLEDGDGLDKDDDWDGGRSLRPPPALLALTAAPEKEGDIAGFRVREEN